MRIDKMAASLLSVTPNSNMLPKYPALRRDDSVSETLFGKTIKDPFRWLEDPDSKETKEFVEAENTLFQNFIGQYKHRSELKERFTKLYNYEKFGCPFKRGSFFYYFHNSGLQAQSILYQLDSLSPTAERRVFYDPNKLTSDGTAALSSFAFSESGKLFAHGISYNGSDWVTIEVQDDTGKKLSDKLNWVKFSSIAWTDDEKGFFYSRYPEPKTDDAGTETTANYYGKLYYHRLGESQEKDILVHKDDANPTWMFSGEVSDDGDYALLSIGESCDPVNKLYVAKLKNKALVPGEEILWNRIVDDFGAKYSYITNEGTRFFFLTNLNAPKYRVVYYDLDKPANGFVEFIAQQDNVILEEVIVFAKDKLAINTLVDVKNVLSIYSLKTGKKIEDVPLYIGSIDSMDGKKKSNDIYFRFVSFLNPGIIYQTVYDGRQFKTSVVRETKLDGFNRADFVVKQEFYTNPKDGTKVPMFITHPKNLPMDGNNPVYLYGYGGFSISLSPFFSPLWVSAMQSFGAVFAVANIRGGAEYGEEWHKAGCLLNKQNGFDDFAAGAEFLIAQKYTNSGKIAINGGSNGGLLATASALQRPDLWNCAVADVGVLDMLRFHKFTIGYAWKSDYGDPENEEYFEYLLKYSPLHNVKPGYTKYPSILLTTSDHDDRVVPLHSYKMIATLQDSCPNNEKPLLIRVETNAGHGAGKSTAKRIEEAVEKFSYIALINDWPWRS